MAGKQIFILVSAIFISLLCLPPILHADPENKPADASAANAEKPPIPYEIGMFRHILNPPGMKKAQEKHPGQQWYINDHCFYVADDGTIHWFGITNPYPGNFEISYAPGSHRNIGHATATKPFGPWTEHENALTTPEGSDDCIGASFVVKHQDQYIMLYGYNTGFHIAVSKDLNTWTTLDKPRVTLGLAGTRDPCIIKLKDGTYLLYAAAGQQGGAGVGLASSTNCIDWKKEAPALVSNVPGEWGSLESPFVLFRDGWYYLFINHSHRQYEETIVFASRDPKKFDWSKPLCTIFGHASEIFEFDGKTYISHCGIEDLHWRDTGAPFGLYLTELGWLEQK